MLRPLLDRDRERSALEARARARGGQLVIVWGRRRAGKTFLLQHFAEAHRTLYFGATQQSEPVELARFTDAARDVFGARDLPPGYVFPDWGTALEAVSERAGRRRLILVLDEFPYLASSSHGLESVVQRWWDHTGRDGSVMLVLCGSAVAYMKQITGAAAPLHQRATASIHVRTLDFRASGLFGPHLAAAERLVVYGILGGTPLYLEQWDERATRRANLLRLFADPASPLVDAAELVLSGELPEPEGAFRILQAVSLGRTRAGEIASYARIAVERPLKKLVTLGLLERRVPALDDPVRTKRAIYRIADLYLHFWFRFIGPNRAQIARGLGDALVDDVILPGLDEYMGPVFEEIAREHARIQRSTDRLVASRVDGWWSADGQHEVDLVGTSGKRVLAFVGSAKWSARPLGSAVLANLEQHAAALPGWDPGLPKVLYGRAGCDRRFTGRADVRCFSAEDLYR